MDSPKEAQSAEQKGAKFESGSPGQNEESEKDAEQKEKPNGTSGGDASSSTSAGSGSASSTVSKVPTEMGDARTQTKVGNKGYIMQLCQRLTTPPWYTAGHFERPGSGREGTLSDATMYTSTSRIKVFANY